MFDDHTHRHTVLWCLLVARIVTLEARSDALHTSISSGQSTVTQELLYRCCSSQKKSAESCVRYLVRDQVARIWRDDHCHKAAHPESGPASLTRRSDIYVSTY